MTENTNSGCSQRNSAEHEGYAKASRSFNLIWKERDSAQSKLMEAILMRAGSFMAVIILGYVLKKVGFFKEDDFYVMSTAPFQ